VVLRHKERLSASRKATKDFDMQRLYLKKLNDAEGTVTGQNLKQVCSFGKPG
jgi:hypothetical protein